MLKAIHKETGVKYISWKSHLEIKEIYNEDKESFICPYCDRRLIFVDGDQVIKHFRHRTENNCEHEPETQIHLEMKEFIQKIFNLSDDEIEYTKLLHYGFKPDGFIEKDNIALEVQHSIISEKDFILRTKKYSDSDIHVLWIFDKNIIAENIPAMIKKAHEIYYGRIYVYDNKNKSMYPIHLTPTKRWVKPFKSYGGYYKYYKSKRGLKIGEEIKTFQLKKSHNTWKDNNYLLANFYDKQFWNGDEERIIGDDGEDENTCECGEWKSSDYDYCYDCGFVEQGDYYG